MFKQFEKPLKFVETFSRLKTNKTNYQYTLAHDWTKIYDFFTNVCQKRIRV